MEPITLNDIRALDFRTYLQCFVFKTGESGEETPKYYCRIENCMKSYKDKSAAIRHLHVNHTQYHDTIHMNNESRTVNGREIELKIQVKIDPEKVWDAVVELTCINSLPLCFVEYPAFKAIIDPYDAALKAQGYTLAINNKNLKLRINGMASYIKNKIRDQVKNKLVGLMADIASRHNKSLLGISISYMSEGEICVRTIAMHLLKYSHTAAYIHKIIEQTLSDYGIQLNQVISVTTDNGRNMVKAISYLDSSYQNTKEAHEDSDEADENGDYTIDHSIFDDDYYESMLTDVRSSFSDTMHTDIIHGISCAAHCLHLVITHAIEKTPAIMSLIDKARTLVKKLRTPTLRSMLSENGLNMAKIDVVTRWNSVVNMVGTFRYFMY